MANPTFTRRTFLTTTALGLAASAFAQEPAAGNRSPNDKVNVAIIGVGGQGKNDLRSAAHLGHNIVALCDVDWRMAGAAFEQFPKARQWKDYREMLDKQRDIDAVVIATPDHHHAFAAMAALEHGKHVYGEKPLTHSVWESRQLAAKARETGLATQMGNAGQAGDDVRVTAEYLQAGAIGPLREIHVWTDRPIWPQGLDRPKDVDTPNEELDWELWLGPAPDRPYNRIYHPFRWRGWWDFGTGALGDMACHAFHPIFYAVGLGHPTSVEVSSTKFNDETFPLASIVRYEFPARGDWPPCTLTWYDGGLKPARPDGLPEDQELDSGGTMYVGDDGVMLNGRLLPEEKMRDYPAPAPTLERSPGHWEEWFRAIAGGPKAGADFQMAGLVTEVVLLGNVAMKAGHKLHWDPDAFTFTNRPDAVQYLHPGYRDGWSL